MDISRRFFLGSSAAAMLSAGIPARGAAFGANDTISVCCVGINGQGGSHIRDISSTEGAEVAALCDVDSQVLERRIAEVQHNTGKRPKGYRDVRDALADDSIDAISIATPNHSHSLIAIWACEAGKDVYVEKPLSHGVWEGRQLVAAAKKYNRVVQHGTQSRSDSRLLRDIRLIHDGFIGKIVHSRGYVYKNGNRHAIGRGKPGDPPGHLDWTLWQGPATDAPYLLNADADNGSGLQVHYNWHWFWNYGNGEIGNQGVHEMDIACWGHNRGLPVYVQSTGGRYGWDDDGETPNTQATSYRFADGSMMTFEVRNLGSFQEADGGNCGNSFFGENGYYVRKQGFFDYRNEPIPVDVEMPLERDRFARFFDAMRSRKPEDNPAPPEAGHESCVLCHIGNIAYRLGRSLEFDPATEQFADAEANRYLKREYRKGFEVPELT